LRPGPHAESRLTSDPDVAREQVQDQDRQHDGRARGRVTLHLDEVEGQAEHGPAKSEQALSCRLWFAKNMPFMAM
jgi:hypothetical protein